jgi:hypothetical protein
MNVPFFKMLPFGTMTPSSSTAVSAGSGAAFPMAFVESNPEKHGDGCVSFHVVSKKNNSDADLTWWCLVHVLVAEEFVHCDKKDVCEKQCRTSLSSC